MTHHAVFGARFAAAASLVSLLALAACSSSGGGSPAASANTAAAPSSGPVTKSDRPGGSPVVPVVAPKPSATSTLAVSCDAFATQPRASADVTLKSGDVLAVSLCWNPSTGFSWEQPKVSGDAVSVLLSPNEAPAVVVRPATATLPADSSAATGVVGTNSATLAEQGPGNVVGAATSTTFLFRADHGGTATVRFSYSRPWAGGEKGVWQYTLHVTVGAGLTPLTLTCDAFAAQANRSADVHLKAGDVLSVALCSNASTGFSWEQPKVAGGAVKVVGRSNGTPASSALGASGSTTFQIRAQHHGTATVTFSYSRPWAGGEKGVWNYTLHVTVD